jgi:hypothetical protein
MPFEESHTLETHALMAVIRPDAIAISLYRSSHFIILKGSRQKVVPGAPRTRIQFGL